MPRAPSGAYRQHEATSAASSGVSTWGMCRFHTPASSRRVIHSRLPSGGRTTIGKSSARASVAMSATVSIENGECSMSTRAKSRPAARSSISTEGVRTMFTHVPIWTSPRSARTRYRFSSIQLLDQAVELPGVLARDLVHHVGRQVAELLLDEPRRLRPDAVGVRIVRAPHERLDTHVVDQLGADLVELERRLALAAPVVAWLHREPKVAEAVFPLEVHPVERVGNPADAALAERDPHVWIPLEHAGADHRGQDVDQVHLEPGGAREERRAAGDAGLLLAHAGRQ